MELGISVCEIDRSIDRLGLVVLVVVEARVWCELLLIRLGFRCWVLLI